MTSENGLYDPDPNMRAEASLQYSLKRQRYAKKWPRACTGAANAWLVMCGPSPGRADRPDDIWPGGPNRPVDEKPTIGPGAGIIEFDTNTRRNDAFMKVASTCFQGSRYNANALTARVNLDWGHNPNAAEINHEYLKAGCSVVFDIMRECRPRVVLTMAGAGGVTWLHLSNYLQDHSKGSVAADCDNMIIELDDCPFSTLVVKTTLHPSRPMKESLLASLEATVRKFIELHG